MTDYDPDPAQPSPPKQSAGGPSVFQGTLAQFLGGAVAATIVTGLASFKIFMQAGFESAFGSLLGIVFFLAFHVLRQK